MTQSKEYLPKKKRHTHTQKTEEYTEMQREYVIDKSQTMGNSTGQREQVFQQ